VEKHACVLAGNGRLVLKFVMVALDVESERIEDDVTPTNEFPD
jgi:hypothetical protein